MGCMAPTYKRKTQPPSPPLHWSELFTDTRLQSLIRRGLENNNDLNVARLKVVEAEATLMSSRLAYLPSVSLAPQRYVE